MTTPFELPIDYTFETDPAEFRTQTGDREDNTVRRRRAGPPARWRR
jgi:hypothetical protein